MYGIAGKRNAANVLGVMAIAVAVAGCDGSAASASFGEQKISPSRTEPREDLVAAIPPVGDLGDRPILHHQMDAARGRLWALTLDGVDLYDARTRQKVAHIDLPGWLWVGERYSCPPDLALGPKGEALISSNVVPTLWRIDPITLAVTNYELVLDDETGKDIGYTGLAYSADQGVFFAVSALRGSLYRIDPLFRRGQNIPLSAPLPNACGVALRPRASDQRAIRLVDLCVRADQGDWVVTLAPDQRSGYVRPGRCGSS